MSPRLSVVIPVKDCLPYLPKAIDSIRRQGIDDIETVVIDDQSTDGLDRWLAEEIKRDPHLKSRPGPGEGVAAARNAGLALCNAPLVAFLDADDSWNENAIADRLSLMEENPEVVLTFADHAGFDVDGRPLGTNFGYMPRFQRWLAGRHGLLPLGERAFNLLFAENVCGTSTVIARRDAIEAAGRFDRRLRICEDWDLDLEKIEAGKLTFVRTRVAMRELAAEAIEANQAFAQGHDVRVVLEPGDADTTVVGDRDRLIQVITNLLSNAIKFSPTGGTVRVRVGQRRDMIRLSVADDGPGIPVEFRERVFMKFAQADTSDTRSKGGTGLGLAVAKDLVERHGGTLSFVTETGRGTVFHVDVPAAKLAAPAPEDDAAAEILVVEDDRDTAVVLRDMLVRSGFSVGIAATAKDAEARAAHPATRLILVDLGLPDRDGIGLIRSLRVGERTRRIPIIVVTARKQDEAGTAEADALEVLDWIEKPVDPARLRQALETAVGPAGSARILHVEDDPDVRQLVAHSLSHAGAIQSVTTVAEAQAAITTQTFDVVILDMSLPDGSGTELLPLLKNRAGEPIPVIVFSARSTDPDVARQVQLVLTKSPNSLDHLVRIVSRLCRSADTQQADRVGGLA